MDVLTPDQRRRNMSCIRGKNTKPEMLVRRGVHAAGLRFRLHVQELPGRPDIVFPRYRAVALVHGCFWHGHDCPMFKLPATQREFWVEKINANRSRDIRTFEALLEQRWRVLTVWECSLKGRGRLQHPEVIAQITDFVLGEEWSRVIEGARSRPASDRSRSILNRFA
jgi:DNA mismatch endonuclease (patch repair protein)